MPTSSQRGSAGERGDLPDVVTPRLLRTWAEALAETGCAAPAVAARAMGITLRPGWLAYAEAVDPPQGIGLMVLAVDEGLVPWASVQLDGQVAIAAAEIEALFGPGEAVPALHPGTPNRRSYPALAGPRATCLPLVDVRAGLVVEVNYRLHPSRPAPR